MSSSAAAAESSTTRTSDIAAPAIALVGSRPPPRAGGGGARDAPRAFDRAEIPDQTRSIGRGEDATHLRLLDEEVGGGDVRARDREQRGIASIQFFLAEPSANACLLGAVGVGRLRRSRSALREAAQAILLAILPVLLHLALSPIQPHSP